MAHRIRPGKPLPLGASWDREGVNFAIYTERATRVDLCLFDSAAGQSEVKHIPLPELTEHVWHGYVPDLRPGQLYGYRVHGPYEPALGLRFNPAKMVVDPYARAIAGKISWEAPVFGYELGHSDADLSTDRRDDAWGMVKGVVVDSDFDWEDDEHPGTPWYESIIYEVHVRGFTARHPDVPPEVRGTYAGLASPRAVDYLKSLGITAVELLPIHEFSDDKHLVDRGLRNYWGYNTINFFSPSARYSSSGDTGEQVVEFKEMVKTLHRAGIEVILDVVYNHAAEGNQLGPTLSFRGIDNPTYYRLVPGQERYYTDYTGTGNTLNVRHPQVLQLIMDSLRYWVLEMHVDGFRFDLAAALAREQHQVDWMSSFFSIIHQDPVLSQVKLIAEPWDVGEDGYQVGNFPVRWTEWNGRYRDTVRRFWRGEEGQVGDLGYRLTGSSDLYQNNGRRPYASINFVTAHDGFTLHDLVSYNEKHNEANGEHNRDGANSNFSCNYGVEGPTNDRRTTGLRERQKRNLLATLLFSQGVPMICGGDELGRTQQGNNNAYCQDNDLSWFDWKLDSRRKALLAFTQHLTQIRRDHPSLRRRKFLQGKHIRGSDVKDITWLHPDGREMNDEDWESDSTKCLGVRLGGEALADLDDEGSPVVDDTLLMVLNARVEPVRFHLPSVRPGLRWAVLTDTNNPNLAPGEQVVKGGERIEVASRSLVLLSRLDPGQNPILR